VRSSITNCRLFESINRVNAATIEKQLQRFLIIRVHGAFRKKGAKFTLDLRLLQDIYISLQFIFEYSVQQDRKFTYNATLSRVCIFAHWTISDDVAV